MCFYFRFFLNILQRPCSPNPLLFASACNKYYQSVNLNLFDKILLNFINGVLCILYVFLIFSDRGPVTTQLSNVDQSYTVIDGTGKYIAVVTLNFFEIQT